MKTANQSARRRRTAVYSACVSQPCRFMRDFVTLGFNEAADGSHRKVFDGVLDWVGGAGGIFLNDRFAEPFRTHREHIGRWYPEFQFPFAWQPTTDPVTGRTDGRLRRCIASATCPKIIEANSENEYWAKDGALLHIDTAGNDLPESDDVRVFLIAGRAHLGGIPVSGPGICQQPRNPLVANSALRALLVELDEWVSNATAAAEHGAARRRRHVGRPGAGRRRVSAHSRRAYNGRMHTGDLLDFGPQAEAGLIDHAAAGAAGAPYPALVPKTDADGNALAGIRLPDIAVPTATYTGWNLRRNRRRRDATRPACSCPLPARAPSAWRAATRGRRWRNATPTMPPMSARSVKPPGACARSDCCCPRTPSASSRAARESDVGN